MVEMNYIRVTRDKRNNAGSQDNPALFLRVLIVMIYGQIVIT